MGSKREKKSHEPNQKPIKKKQRATNFDIAKFKSVNSKGNNREKSNSNNLTVQQKLVCFLSEPILFWPTIEDSN